MGSFPRQQTAGKYIDETLYENLKILAKNIVRDMTFLGVCYSSTLEVGTGKSVFTTQIGEAYTEMINQLHNLNLTFTEKNIVFRPKDLIERAFQLPKYSCIVLDEWEDYHFWSELGMSLRQFFRKCRQLNLFIIVIIPNFFQLPIAYAISRSVFAIDVKFVDEFERGYFSFYNFQRKKQLYLKGKKNFDYDCVKPNFIGRFTDGYGVPEKEYRKAKYRDMVEAEEKRGKKNPTEKQIKAMVCRQLKKNLPELTYEKLGVGFGVSKRTISRWLSDEEGGETEQEEKEDDTET